MSTRITSLLLACLLPAVPAGRLFAADKPARTDAYGDPLPPGALLRLGTMRWRACARFLAFTPDGKTLVTCEGLKQQESVFRRWDAATGAECTSFHHAGSVRPCALSPDGKELALTEGRASESIVFVRTSDGKELRRIADTPPLMRVCYSPDGGLLAGVENNGAVHIWRVVNGEELPRGDAKNNDPSARISFSPDGKTLAVAAWPHLLRLTEVATGHERWKRGLDQKLGQEYTMVAFLPDGKKLLWQGEDAGSFALWDAGTGELLRSFRASKGKARPVALSPDGKWIASLDVSGNDPPYWGLWDAATGKEFRKLPAPVGSEIGVPNEPVFSPDGKKLASSGDCDGLIHMWDVETGKNLALTGEQRAVVCAVGLSSDGREVLTGCMDGGVRVWDAETGAVRRRIAVDGDAGVPALGTITFSRDRRTALATDFGRNADIWDISSGNRRASLYGFGYPAWDATFAPDGKTLATLGEGLEGVQLWDADSGKKTALISVGRVEGAQLAFSPDGKTLAIERRSSSMDGAWSLEMALWDVTLGKRIRQWPLRPGFVPCELLFAPDGRSVLRSQIRELNRFDPASGKELPALRVPEDASADERLSCQAYSPDGRTLAAGTDRGDIYLWEASTTKIRGVLKGHRNGAFSLEFSSDGTRLLSGGGDTTALIWDLTGLADEKGAKTLTSERLAAAWDDLADADAGKAYRAGWRLASDPEASVSFLRKRLRAAEVDAEAVAKALAALDSDDFDEREAASRRLAAFGDLAGPAVRTALEAKPSDEARRRMEELLHRLDGPVEAPEQARALRGVEVLEHVGSAEARRLLDELAKGAPGAALTRDAKAALARLANEHSDR